MLVCRALPIDQDLTHLVEAVRPVPVSTGLRGRGLEGADGEIDTFL